MNPYISAPKNLLYFSLFRSPLFYVISKIYRTLIWASLLQRDIYFPE